MRSIGAVEEHFLCTEAYDVNRGGAQGRENAGMSNRKSGESPDRRKSKVSSAMSISRGLGGPKDNPGLGQGRPMDSWLIFQLLCIVWRSDGGKKVKRVIGFTFSGSRIAVW